jgi:NADPH-dependent curcumin reductase CurA
MGLLAFDYQHRADEALGRLASLVEGGHIRVREEFLDGLDEAPDSIAGLYRGENLGKRIIRLENLDSTDT